MTKRKIPRTPQRKKTWKKSVSKTETWRTGRYSVSRSSKGRFVQWHKIRHYEHRKVPYKAKRRPRQPTARVLGKIGLKRIAVYGTRNGKRRRWVIVGRGGQHHYEAVREAYIHSPRKQFTIVDADTMLDYEEEYIEGYWDDKPTVEPEY
jgi:hypothetical protein